MWKTTFQRITSWIRANGIYFAIGLFVVANIALLYHNFFSPEPPTPPEPVVIDVIVPSDTIPSPLNGAYVPLGTEDIRPMAVMLDHSPEARPLTGISQASIVFETLAEGGVTRLMPIFQTLDDVTIGPVRSAREYFLPWARAFESVYVHSGGSVAGLAALRAHRDIPDADEFSNGASFYRNPSIAAPHNLFTSIGRLRDLVVKRQWSSDVSYSGWTVTDEVPSGQEAQKITVDFSITPYRVIWTYDKENGLYRRTVGGVIAEDRATRQQLMAKNIIVLFAQVDPAPPPAPIEGVVVQSVGKGEAWFFRDGVMNKGTWEKATFESPLVFKKTDGASYGIARGQVWIEVVNKNKANAVTTE